MATTFFWVLTAKAAQRQAGIEVLATFEGKVDPVLGDTRQSLFCKIREFVAGELERSGQPGGHGVLFFSLEPNEIGEEES